VLLEIGYKPVKCTNLEEIKLTLDYREINKIRQTKWAIYSLRKLIDSGFFEYSFGILRYQTERFFLVESSFMYILEKELKKTKDGLKVLWQVSFDFGKKLAKLAGKQDPCKFIMDFFPALGFGDVLVLKRKNQYEIFVNYFPWFKYANEVDFTMFRGILSGTISGLTGEKVELKNFESELGNWFSLRMW
jgi:hypothetical protein